MTAPNDTATEESWLGERVRALLAANELPHEPATHVWGGPGGGYRCAVCQNPISAEQVEFEALFPSQTTARFHRSCHAAWERERRRMRQ